jgi:hypothetical protein
MAPLATITVVDEHHWTLTVGDEDRAHSKVADLLCDLHKLAT